MELFSATYDGWKMDEFIVSEVEKVGNWLILSPYVLVVFLPFRPSSITFCFELSLEKAYPM